MLIDIFNFKQSYDDDYESFCTSNCICQILKYYRVKYAPFFINSSLSLTLVENEKAEFGYNLLFDRSLVLSNFENKVKLNIPHNKSTIEVWEENKTKVREGIPLIVGVDIFNLKYTPYYRKYHSNHRVILCGYSEIQDYVTIIDHYQWVYKGNIEIDSFFEARSSLCPKDDGPYSGRPINNVWLEVDSDGWEANPEELLFTTVFRSLEKYYNINSYYKKSSYFGIDALKKILEIINQYKEIDKACNMVFFGKLHFDVLCLYTRLKLFKYYIRMSSSTVKLDILPKINEQIVEDLKEWELLLRLIIKAIYTKEDLLYKIVNRLRKIIAIEEKRYDILIRLNNILFMG